MRTFDSLAEVAWAFQQNIIAVQNSEKTLFKGREVRFLCVVSPEAAQGANEQSVAAINLKPMHAVAGAIWPWNPFMACAMTISTAMIEAQSRIVLGMLGMKGVSSTLHAFKEAAEQSCAGYDCQIVTPEHMFGARGNMQNALRAGKAVCIAVPRLEAIAA